MTPARKKRWKWAGGILFGALVLGLALSWIVGGLLCAPCNHPVPLPKDFPVVSVHFPSTSGTTVSGWLAGPKTFRGVIILLHGVRANKATLLSRARFLTRAGYEVLLMDFQAHGESPGRHITFGYLESRDVSAAVAFVKQQFPNKPIGVLGTSMGGAAALLATPPLDVQALILESVFPTIEDATKDRMEWVLGRPARLLAPLLTTQFRWRIGVLADQVRPIDHVGDLTMPKLFLAGTKDVRTKFSEAQEMFARAASPKEFYPVTGAGHEDLYGFLGAKYEELVLNFLNQNLK